MIGDTLTNGGHKSKLIFELNYLFLQIVYAGGARIFFSILIIGKAYLFTKKNHYVLCTQYINGVYVFLNDLEKVFFLNVFLFAHCFMHRIRRVIFFFYFSRKFSTSGNKHKSYMHDFD